MNKPPKLKVIQVGYLDEEGKITGFCFSGEGIHGSVGLSISVTGVHLYGGYTHEELVQMIKDKVSEDTP